MVACFVVYHIYIAYANVPKFFLILTITSNNSLYCNIIIYNFNPFIDIMILKISMLRLFLTLIDIIPNLNLNNIFTMLFTKVYSYQRYGKRMKLISELIKYMITYMS